jgi:hypothetical protein
MERSGFACKAQICTDAARAVSLDGYANLTELCVIGQLHNHHGCSVLPDCATFASFTLFI